MGTPMGCSLGVRLSPRNGGRLGDRGGRAPMLSIDPTTFDLSAQQQLVLSLSATGLTSAEVASALHVPVQEVQTYLASAIQALGARSKLEAVIVALRYDLISS